jgi:DNA replication and repair protein RecF
MVSPNDSIIVTDGSEERRKFVDNVISQTDNKYLDTLIIYNKFLAQRNSLLKQARQTSVLDLGLIEILNFQLEEVGNIIFQKEGLLWRSFSRSLTDTISSSPRMQSLFNYNMNRL